MGIMTLVRFLLFDRQAILQLAANRWAVRLGFLFVLSAGFAREYDGEDLWHEPWHLLLPIAASIMASFVLFCVASPGTSRKEGPTFFAAYRSFLGLFWMTAPLAWLYAIPYERFLSPVDAMRANLISLGIVAAWRVLLMIRVLVVLFDFGMFQAMFRVMICADALALAALSFLPVPILDIMGGIRLSESDRMLRETATTIAILGFYSAPIWFIGAMATWIVSDSGKWQASAVGSQATRPIVILACSSVAIWAAILPFTQPEQQLRYQVEQDFKFGHIASALAKMSKHSQEEFPPHWLPPPRYFAWHGYTSPSLLDVIEEMQKAPTTGWVREFYLRKLVDQWTHRSFASEDELKRLAKILVSIPEGDAILKELEQDELRQRDYPRQLKAFMNEARIAK